MKANRGVIGLVALFFLLLQSGCGGWYRRWGIKDEKELHSFGAVPKLIKALERGSCQEMHNAAAVLFDLGEQARSALWALEGVVKKHDCMYRMRLPAARALGRLGRSSLPMLQKMASDKDGIVRYLAVVGLGEMTYTPEVVVGILNQKITSTDPLDDRGAREEAYYALGRQGKAARLAIPLLVEQLADPQWRRYAMDCLVAIGHPAPEALEALEKLEASLEDAEERQQVRERIDKLRASGPAGS